MRRALFIAVFVSLVVATAGCHSTDLSGQNDELRARVADLEDQVRSLEGRNEELQAELTDATAPVDPLPPEIRENTPRPAALSISRLSHVRTEDSGGHTLVVYVVPEDGLGRFVQLVGSLSVHAALLGDGSDALTIGRVTLDPGELRAAYRSTVTGTRYTVEVPIEVPHGAGGLSSATVTAVYKDGRTGRRLEVHGSVKLAAAEK